MAGSGMTGKTAGGTGFGLRLRGLRGFRGWTQADAAKAAGISLNAFSNLERGEADPTMDTLVKLADAFAVSLDWLVRGDAPSAAA